MPFNAIRDYWDRSHFRGHPTYYETMGRDRFKTIRANLQVHEPFTEGAAFLNRKDPLYYIRNVLVHLQRRCYEVAVPLGPTALDENGQPSSGKTFGTSYNPNKPQPHAFRFYCFNSPFPNYSLRNEFIRQTVGGHLVRLTRRPPKPLHHGSACRIYKQINLCRLCMIYFRQPDRQSIFTDTNFGIQI